MKTVKVKSIKKVGTGTVKNLTVYKNHTFVTKNGIVTHNCDYLLPATQAALRNAIESFSQTCKFIFTCNHPNRIISPLHSRCTHVKFDVTKAELETMQARFFMRVCEILDHEKVTYNESVLVNVVQRFYPDCRKTLNELQAYGRSGTIDEGIFSSIKEIELDSIIKYLKERNFKDVRQWAAESSGNDTGALYGDFYQYFVTTKSLKPSSIPVAIQILSDSQRYDAVVPDKELHLAAMCVSLMSELEWN